MGDWRQRRRRRRPFQWAACTLALIIVVQLVGCSTPSNLRGAEQSAPVQRFQAEAPATLPSVILDQDDRDDDEGEGGRPEMLAGLEASSAPPPRASATLLGRERVGLGSADERRGQEEARATDSLDVAARSSDEPEAAAGESCIFKSPLFRLICTPPG